MSNGQGNQKFGVFHAICLGTVVCFFGAWVYHTRLTPTRVVEHVDNPLTQTVAYQVGERDSRC